MKTDFNHTSAYISLTLSCRLDSFLIMIMIHDQLFMTMIKIMIVIMIFDHVNDKKINIIKLNHTICTVLQFYM